MILVNSDGTAFVVDSEAFDSYKDTVYDALASANRISRANYQAIVRLESVLMWGIIMVGVIYLLGKRN